MSDAPGAVPVLDQPGPCRCFQFPHERGDRSAPCRHSLTEAEEALFTVVRRFTTDTREKRDWPRIADEQAVKIVLGLAGHLAECERAAAEKALRDAAGDLLLACSHFNRYRNQPEWCGYCESAVESMLGGSPDYKEIVRDRTDREADR